MDVVQFKKHFSAKNTIIISNSGSFPKLKSAQEESCLQVTAIVTLSFQQASLSSESPS